MNPKTLLQGQSPSQDKIPWQDQTHWEQVFDSIQRIDNRQPGIVAPVRNLALRIRERYDQLSEVIEKICIHTCPDCTDICCMRATLWFDFKDLLCIYFASGSFPQTQISKKVTDGLKACCHLTSKGCVLPRNQRPFVCTWYFCPAQKEYLSMQSSEMRNIIEEHLKEIKHLREKMENEFIRAASI